MHSTLFLLACILVPAAWGLVASWVYDLIAARYRRHGQPAPEKSDPMYYI